MYIKKHLLNISNSKSKICHTLKLLKKHEHPPINFKINMIITKMYKFNLSPHMEWWIKFTKVKHILRKVALNRTTKYLKLKINSTVRSNPYIRWWTVIRYWRISDSPNNPHRKSSKDRFLLHKSSHGKTSKIQLCRLAGRRDCIISATKENQYYQTFITCTFSFFFYS